MSDEKLGEKELYLCADKIFGEKNWPLNITNQLIDYVSETENSIEISCTTSTKVSVNNGVSRESLGTSVIMNKNKSIAFGQVRENSFCHSLQNTLSSFTPCKNIIEKEKRLKKSKGMQAQWKAIHLDLNDKVLFEMKNDSF